MQKYCIIVKVIEMNVGKASISKRILSGVMDLILIFLFTSLFMFGIFYLFVNNNSQYQSATQEYQQIHISSHLFTLEDGELTLIDENYDECLTKCFDKYDSLDEYYDHKEKSELFNSDGSVKDDATGDKLFNFYQGEINYAITNFIQKEPLYAKNYQYIIKIQTIVIVSSCLLSVSIFELIIPLCLKNGKTIGKLVTHLAIVKSDGFKVKKKNIIIRFVSYFVINILLGLYSYGLILILSFMLSCFNYRGMSIHDFISSTTIIDDLNYVIYENENEQNLLEVKCNE